MGGTRPGDESAFPVSSIPDGEKTFGVPEDVMRMYLSGDKLGATDAFMSKLGGQDYHASIDRAISVKRIDQARR